jgi:hypothetical protein
MPRYETPADIAREAALQARLERYWRLPFIRLPRLEPVDWLVADAPFDRVVGIVEAKCRKVTRTEYPDVWLAEDKRMALDRYTAFWGLDSNRAGIFVVQWTDVTGFIRMGKTRDCRVELDYRRSRGPKTRELLVMVPTDTFTLLPPETV